MNRTVLFFAVSALGCRSVPPGAPEPVEAASLVRPADDWNEPRPGAPIAPDFWKHFDCPTLDALIAEGLAASPTLAAASSRVMGAAAALEAAAGADLPAVQASLSSLRARNNFVGFPIPGSSGVLTTLSTSLALSLGVSWELDLWGRLASAERAAAASLDAEGLDLIAARQSLAAQIAKAAFALAEAKGAEKLAHRAVQNADELAASARRMLALGSGRSEDLLNAEAQLAAARADEIAASRRSAQLAPPLAVLLGRSAGRGAALDETELTALVAQVQRGHLPEPPAAGLPAELLARRPDLAALEARVRAAQANTEAAHAALLPSLSLTTSVGTAGNQLQNLIDGDFRVWNLGANVLAPLFNGGGLKAQETLALSERDAALFAFASGALTAFAEVDGALTGEALSLARIEQLKLYRDKLLASEKLLESKSRRGSAPAAAVFAARAQSLAAESQLLTARRELLTARIDLYLALGGGFEADAQPDSES